MTTDFKRASSVLRLLALLSGGAGFLVAISLTGCSKGGAEEPVILARIGDRAITVDDFEAEVSRRIATGRPIESRESLLEEMIAYEAMLQRAENLGLMEDPAVKREIGLLLISKLRERELSPQLDAVEIAEAETRAAYESRLADYTRPAKVRLAILLLETQPGMSEGRRTEVRERMAEARELATTQPPATDDPATVGGFGQLSVRYSDDQGTRYRGGDIGWMTPGDFNYRWPREVLAAGYALAKGGISEPIETTEGLFLVKKTDAREAVVTPFEDVASALSQSLATEKRRQLTETYRDDAIRETATEIDHDALSAVILPRSVLVTAQRTKPQPPALPGVTSSAHVD